MLYICSTTNSREETHHENSSELQEVKRSSILTGFLSAIVTSCVKTTIFKPALCVNMNKHAEIMVDDYRLMTTSLKKIK